MARRKKSETFTCEFCNKELASERTLIAHSCVRKLRWLDRETKPAITAFVAYQNYYKMYFKTHKTKTQDDFIRSQYYSDFLKFGKHVVSLKLKHPEDFINYVLGLNQKLNNWCSNLIVEEYFKQKQIKENWEMGVEKTILTMQEWSVTNGKHWTEYFDTVSTTEAVHHIRLGKISPWILYNSKKAHNLLVRMNIDQLEIVQKSIDTKAWKRKMLKEKEETDKLIKFIKETNI